MPLTMANEYESLNMLTSLPFSRIKLYHAALAWAEVLAQAEGLANVVCELLYRNWPPFV